MDRTTQPARSGGRSTRAAAPPFPLGEPAPLIGRHEELSALRGALADGRPIVLVGEPGIGKTALLRSALAGWSAFVGGGLGTLGSIPYLALTRAVGPLPDGDPALIAREMLGRVGADEVLALDDLHWADDATIEVVGRLVGHRRLVGAIRTADQRASQVREALLAAGVRELRVGPLDETEAVALARNAGPSLGAVAARSLVAMTGGNPLLIEELARGGVSTSLRLALAHRLHGLDPESRRLLDLLAFARTPLPVSNRTRAIRRLVDAGLAAHAPGGVEVRHALIADVVVDQADPAQHRSIHRAVAALASEPADAARHLAAAGDRRAAHDLAIDAAASSPPAQRVMLLAIAAECADGSDAPRLRVEAAEQLSEAGLHAEAERLLALVPDTADELGARRLCVYARTRWVLGDSAAALRAGEAGLRIVGGSGTALEARLLVEHATTRMKQREGAVAASLARRGLDLLEALHLPVSTAKRIQAVGMMITDAPRATWEPLLHEARADAQREGDVAAELAAGNMMVSADEASGDPLAARRLAAELVETARAHGLVDMELSIRTTVLSNFNSQGEYERVVTDGFELLGEPMARRLRAETAGYTALALVDLGRLDDAKALIDDELARAEDAAIGHYDLTWAAAELAFASGDLARTESIADECLRLMGDADYQDVFFMRVLRMWARTLSGRDPGEPLAYSRELESLWLGLVPESAAIRLLHDAAGEASLLAVEAAGRFEEAADLFAPYHRRSELRCRWASGEALRRAGRTADARVVLEACEARAEELGMVPLTNRIRRSLRLAGVRRSAPRARSGRLSARESEVLALVADGLTNAEIALRLGIGRPTVVRIVANASAKLGATTRAQAAVQALEVG